MTNKEDWDESESQEPIERRLQKREDECKELSESVREQNGEKVDDIVHAYLQKIATYAILVPEDEKMVGEELACARSEYTHIVLSNPKAALQIAQRLGGIAEKKPRHLIKKIDCKGKKIKETIDDLSRGVEELCESAESEKGLYKEELVKLFENVITEDHWRMELAAPYGGNREILGADYERAQEMYVRYERARETLFKSIARYTFSLGKKNAQNNGQHINPEGIMDNVAEANIGALLAIERWNPSIGRLTTYATWWINARLNRNGNRDSLEGGIRAEGRSVLSLDAEYKEEGCLANSIGCDDRQFGEVEEKIDSGVVWQKAKSLIGETRVYRVIRARCEGQTLEDIGAKEGLTRERIRQIETEGLNDLRRLLRMKKYDGLAQDLKAVFESYHRKRRESA